MDDRNERDQREPSAAAAADLLPLARAIVGLMPKLRMIGTGLVPPPTELSVVFLYTACQGVAQYLATEWPEALPPRVREGAYEVAPQLAHLLHEFVVKHRQSGS